MPQAIPMIVGAAATAAVGGGSAIVFAGSVFAMTGATFGAVVGGLTSLAMSSFDRPPAPQMAQDA
jgi:hypothetical protein